MLINVIATGSSGNLYEIVDKKGNSLLIEAGIPRQTFVENREGENPPEMCIISHDHSDHSGYANEYEMICKVHRWRPTAESQNFKAFGFKVLHGEILNYAYLINLKHDNDFIFFATDFQWDDENITGIVDKLKWLRENKGISVTKFMIEVNYNDYLYHLANDGQRFGCDRHFSDNDVVRFMRLLGISAPRIITIHGSNSLSADNYTHSYLSKKFPAGRIGVAIGVKNGVKNLFNI